MRLSSSLPFALLALAARGDAIQLKLSGRHPSPPALQRRMSMSGATQLDDVQNIVYLINVTLNDEPIPIMIDTGSSDLWVSQTVTGAVPENYQGSVTYASGSASGDVMSATLDFAGFSIESQFYIYAPDGTASGGAQGLIGLGPSSGSSVRVLGNSSAANPPLDRIFSSNSSVSPILAVLLQRSDDPDEPYPGDLSVGEVLSDYKDVLNQPRHAVTLDSVAGGQHWQTLLDENGILVNGQPIKIKTQVTGAQTNNATVVFDTGFTLPQLPPYVAQAIYGNVPGASLTNITGLGNTWTLPCDQEVNVTFIFAGVEFPIHPLDLNFDGLGLKDNNGQPLCIGAFQPISFDPSAVEGNEIIFDMILGMAFLRNAYMVINFGNLVDAATPSTDSAYIQLLPITNATEASQDFANVRKGSGGSGMGNGNTLEGSSGTGTGTGSSSKPSKPWLTGVIAGAAILLILLLGGVIAFCCRRRRMRNASPPSAVWAANPPSYRPIHDPSPQAAYDMHMASGAPPAGYNTQYMSEYKTAWDARY